MSRLLLQICTAVLALVPIFTGIITMLGVRDPLYRPLHLLLLDAGVDLIGTRRLAASAEVLRNMKAAPLPSRLWP